jgi:hypothetical protein
MDSDCALWTQDDFDGLSDMVNFHENRKYGETFSSDSKDEERKPVPPRTILHDLLVRDPSIIFAALANGPLTAKSLLAVIKGLPTKSCTDKRILNRVLYLLEGEGTLKKDQPDKRAPPLWSLSTASGTALPSLAEESEDEGPPPLQPLEPKEEVPFMKAETFSRPVGMHHGGYPTSQVDMSGQHTPLLQAMTHSPSEPESKSTHGCGPGFYTLQVNMSEQRARTKYPLYNQTLSFASDSSDDSFSLGRDATVWSREVGFPATTTEMLLKPPTYLGTGESGPEYQLPASDPRNEELLAQEVQTNLDKQANSVAYSAFGEHALSSEQREKRLPPESLPPFDSSKCLEHVSQAKELPPASPERADAFHRSWLKFLLHQDGNFEAMTLGELFRDILDPIAGTLDGSLSHTAVFQRTLRDQLQFTPCDKPPSHEAPIDPSIARFLGKSFVPGNIKTKEWKLQTEKTGWFHTWSEHVWDEKEGCAVGAAPASGPKFVRKSVNAQLGGKKPRTREYSSRHLAAYTEGHPAPIWDDTETVLSWVQRSLREITSDKGTAWNKCSGEPTKGAWIANRDNVITVLYRFFLITATNHELLQTATPLSQFQAGLVFPDDLFSKNEIHKLKKYKSGKLRVIWNCSVSNDVLIRLFHHVQNKLEIQLYQNGLTHSEYFPTFGSACGCGHDDNGIADMCKAMKNMLALREDDGSPSDYRLNNGVSTDANGWDMSVSKALWGADGWRRAELAREGGAPRSFSYGLINLSITLASHIIVIGGYLYEVQRFGIMPSGIPSTTASNCFMRGFIHSEGVNAISVETGGGEKLGLSLSVGDDNHGADSTTEAHRSVWSELGADITDALDLLGLTDSVSYTSHAYDLDNETATFENGPKLLLRLAYADHMNLTKEQATGIRYAVRHTPKYAVLVDDFIRQRDASWLDIDLDADPNIDVTTVF